MGGGAGINFELHMGAGECFFRGGKLVKATWSVESFDAHGYMDGWSNIDGKYLKVVSVSANLTREDLQYAKENYDLKDGARIGIGSTGRGEHPKFLLFSGFVRGDYRKWFPISVDAYTYVDYFGEMQINVTVEPARGFHGMYDDVFERWAYHRRSWTGRKWEKR